MTYLNLPLTDFHDLRLRASRDEQVKIVVMTSETNRFYIALCDASGSVEVVLQAPMDKKAQAFTDIEACVRVAVEISAKGEVFFDRSIRLPTSR